MRSNSSMTRLLLLVPLCFAALLSGCVGLGATWIGTDETLTTNPKVEPHRGRLSPTTYPTPQLSTDALRNAWGEPSRKEGLAGASELWRYDFDLRWNGMGVLIAFIPLPLVIPVGHEYVEFLFKDGLATSVRTAEQAEKGSLGCAYFLVGVHGPPAGRCDAGPPRHRSSRFFDTGVPPSGFLQ